MLPTLSPARLLWPRAIARPRAGGLSLAADCDSAGARRAPLLRAPSETPPRDCCSSTDEGSSADSVDGLPQVQERLGRARHGALEVSTGRQRTRGDPRHIGATSRSRDRLGAAVCRPSRTHPLRSDAGKVCKTVQDTASPARTLIDKVRRCCCSGKPARDIYASQVCTVYGSQGTVVGTGHLSAKSPGGSAHEKPENRGSCPALRR
jgi:hypothetical protein